MTNIATVGTTGSSAAIAGAMTKAPAMGDKPAYMRGLSKPTPLPQLVCPCCAAVQPVHSAIAYCDDCNIDACGHNDDDETLDMFTYCWKCRDYHETGGCDE